MKRLIIVPILLLVLIVNGQEKLKSNGFNLESLCPKPCNYTPFIDIIYFPFDYDKEWQIENLEIAIKPSGDFLITGDLNIVGKDTAAILQLEFPFYDENSQNIHIYKPDKFEFFNDLGHAEPIVFFGKIPAVIAASIKFANVEISSSERVPYYTISSNCFHPCKSHKLKEAMKAFKKIK